MLQAPIARIGFLETISYDIIVDIFLYLDQQDCLNCMATCREWYDRIPQFTQANWKTLQLNKNGITQCQEQNLGKHVKHIIFTAVSEDILSKMMEKLLNCGCTKIESLELTNCISGITEKQQKEFLNLLRRLASHQLTHLNMNNHNWNYSIIDIFSVCPHLTHFSFHARADSASDYEPLQLIPSDPMTYNSLVYLHVDMDSPIIKRHIQSVIYRSPNLRYYIGANRYNFSSKSQMLLPAEWVLSHCPKIEYYVGNGGYVGGEKFIRNALIESSVTSLLPTSTTINNNYNSNNEDERQHGEQQNTFHSLAMCDNADANQIVLLLRKYKDTLKHVRLIGANRAAWHNRCDWAHIFETTPIQQLHTLYCDNLNCSMKPIITLLNTCRNTIQQVQLEHPKYELLDVSTFQALKPLPQLRILSLQYVDFANKFSVITLLERLPSLENLIVKNQATFLLPEEATPFLKSLKQLTLVDIYSFVGSSKITIELGLFRSLAQDGSKLERISLTGSDDSEIPFVMLNALVTLPSLKFLYVSGIERCLDENHDEEYKDEPLPEFFKQLLLGCDNKINSNVTTTTSRSKIEYLTLSSIYQMTYTMLNSLGDVANLQYLDISLSSINVYLNNIKTPPTSGSPCLNIDICGVLELLCKGKNLRKVMFRGVISFSEEPPSNYLKRKLLLRQQTSLQLRKYIVQPGYPRRLNKSFFDSDLEIVNKHYK